MLKTTFTIPDKKGLKLLLLGAHCDDIEIGCGGSLLKIIDEYDINQITWVVFTSDEVRKKEALISANEFLKPIAQTDIKVLDFKDGYLPSNWEAVKAEFEDLKQLTPDIIFTHYRNDLHQDHRTINELTWNTFRNHFILEYEITKYDGDLGTPNIFIPLSDKYLRRKKEILLNSFKSQLKKQWFDDTLLTSIMRIRGVECASETSYAEAFYGRKLML